MLTSGFLWSLWWGKGSRHSRRMRNQQFYVSGKRPMAWCCQASDALSLVFHDKGFQIPVPYQCFQKTKSACEVLSIHSDHDMCCYETYKILWFDEGTISYALNFMWLKIFINLWCSDMWVWGMNNYTHMKLWDVITDLWPKFNSSPPGAAFMLQWIGSALIQIMACCLFSTSHYRNQC